MSTLKKISKELEKKLNKTKEARQGKGIYKRRNARNYRVVMSLSTYKKIMKENPSQLNVYERGYAVRINPNDFFNSAGDRKDNVPESLELGKNSFLYFKNIKDWQKYGEFCKDFEEVTELSSLTDSTQPDELRSWFGEYCLYIKNAKPPLVSLICGSTTEKGREVVFEKFREELPSKIENLGGSNNFIIDEKLPVQTGLGNFDFDYASPEEVQNVFNQMIYMAFKIPDFKSSLSSQTDSITIEDIDEFEKKIIKECEDNDLLDFEKLSDIGAWDKINNYPICPLCKFPILSREFLLTAEQAEGRKEEDNTQAEIVLMHIKALRAGEFNHRIYNLGWGHKHCNAIQSDQTIDETLEDLVRILENNGMHILRPND